MARRSTHEPFGGLVHAERKLTLQHLIQASPMRFDSKSMSPAAFREDVGTLARLVGEARVGGVEQSRTRGIQRVLQHLATSPSFSFVLLLALFLTILLAVFRVLPPGAPALLLCYPFGLGLVLCSIDALLAWRDRKLLSLLWALVWVTILVIINVTLVVVALS